MTSPVNHHNKLTPGAKIGKLDKNSSPLSTVAKMRLLYFNQVLKSVNLWLLSWLPSWWISYQNSCLLIKKSRSQTELVYNFLKYFSPYYDSTWRNGSLFYLEQDNCCIWDNGNEKKCCGESNIEIHVQYVIIYFMTSFNFII